MRTLFDTCQLDKAKPLDLLPLSCMQCEKQFFRTKNDIQRAERTTNHPCNYCSQECHYKHKTKEVTVICAQCSATVKKREWETKKSKNLFCNKSCAASYNNVHKKRGTRRSKLEQWLEGKLTSTYDFDFHFNRKDAIGSELDIYIPSLSLAFELNGIYHYEAIHGNAKLTSVQKSDARKFQNCLASGIELCIIDTSSLNYFKEIHAERFWGIIKSVIDQNINHK